MRKDTFQSDVALAQAVARDVAALGGRVYYVGGYVRDMVLGRESKDVDIEVHGIDEKRLVGVLENYGHVGAMGASFGILSVRGHDLDIALPQAEPTTPSGDPRQSTYEAARRRDLTINALYQDVLTGEVVDHFGGLADIERRTLRHVDERTFVADPLRVMRVAQFAARFEMDVAESTRALCANIDLAELSRERVLEELRKALIKAPRPSAFFQTLRDMGQLSPWFDEVDALVGVPQNPLWHPEGDVFTHTMLVVDNARALMDKAENGFAFMLSSLCHDFGKAAATREQDGRIISHGHETAGIPLAKALLNRLGCSKKDVSYVLSMVELHMAPNANMAQGAKQRAYNRLFDQSVCPRDLLLLARADASGRGGASDDIATAQGLEDRLLVFEELMERPYVQGRDLIEAGMRPGPAFGDVLAYAHKLRLAGISKDEQLRQCQGYWRKLERES